MHAMSSVVRVRLSISAVVKGSASNSKRWSAYPGNSVTDSFPPLNAVILFQRQCMSAGKLIRGLLAVGPTLVSAAAIMEAGRAMSHIRTGADVVGGTL